MVRKILVIDDEPLILAAIETALTKVGYQVTATTEPGEFINALINEGADLLIVDLHLGNVDTEALIAKAHGISPDSKLLIVSGSVAEIQWENYLQKPFRISDLRDKARELLGGP